MTEEEGMASAKMTTCQWASSLENAFAQFVVDGKVFVKDLKTQLSK